MIWRLAALGFWLVRWMARRLVWASAGLVLRAAFGGAAGGTAMRVIGLRALWWRVLRLTLFVALLAGLWAGMARAQPWLADPFEPGSLSAEERRLVQAALALSGDYRGRVDGLWGAESAAALASWAWREARKDRPAFADLQPLVRQLEEERRRGGWDVLEPESGGISYLFPFGLLDMHEEGDTLAFASRDGSLTARVSFGWRSATAARHRSLREGLAEPVQELGDDTMLTLGRLPGGESLHLRSDLVAGMFHTVEMRAAPEQVGRLALMAGSVTRGPGQGLVPPAGGRIAAMLGPLLAPRPETSGPRSETLPRPGPPLGEPTGSGTGFYVTGTDIVTAAHVIEGCGRVALADGARLRIVLQDDRLDLAVLSAPAQGEGFLALRPDARARLGAPVMALGYPYQGLIEQGLTVTGGNVSALAGPRQPRLMISAPVQPGNSGGPLIDGGGAVIGVVVSRLDDMKVFEATGSLPQNMNFAVPVDELARFLDRARVTWPAAGSIRHDLSAGVPDEIVAAVVPVYCYD